MLDNRTMPVVQQVLSAIRELPLVKPLRQARYARRFAGDCYGGFKGVFHSFEAAERAAPRAKHLGFDHPDYPSHHLDRMSRIELHDYPAMFWLNSILAAGSVVFDFGGNVGVHYYAYRKYLSYPDDLTWIVSELPAMAQRGREIARGQSAAARLSFVEDLTDLARADVFLAAGVLQYLPAFDLAGALGSLARKIPNLIFNKLPLYAGERFVTLQNAGSIVLPQHVWNRAQFLEPLERIGYELVDSWNVAGYSCLIPFHPEQSVPMYSGLYMRLR